MVHFSITKGVPQPVLPCMHKFSKFECQYCERYNIIPKIDTKKKDNHKSVIH